ncbi:MAG: hypothetical protein JSV74_00120 [Dehalococcoidia bacterium]|nr:MAG: hypothetical protein JSV74_00120 [Dehalococcoidia bacterium]
MKKWISIAITGLLVVVIVICLFLYIQESSSLKSARAEIVSLEEDISSLEDNIATLEINLDAAQGEITVLESDIAENEEEISSLQSNLTSVENKVLILESDIESKDAEISGLESDLITADTEIIRLEGELVSAQDDIEGLAQELTTTQAEVESQTQALVVAQEENVSLETQISEWESAYERINSEIYQKLGYGDDASSYLTPDNQTLSNLAATITGGLSQDWDEHWSDILRLYDWTVNNIEYNFDTPLPILPDAFSGDLDWIAEYWQLPTETIEVGTGDCEDMAVLLNSLILSYEDEQYPTWGIGITSDFGGHLAVALPVNESNLVVLDPAGNFYTSELGLLDTTKSIAQAIDEWLQYWSFQLPGVYVDFVFGKGFSEEFTNTNAFLTWASSQ